MTTWWRKADKAESDAPRERAVAYYRHSSHDRQENSIPIQREQVREWAQKNGIEIVREFADHGKSGLSAEHRDAFNDMLENWVKKRDDFRYVLVLDVSRWGRFQDVDLSATYSAECTRHGKQVVYTSLGLPKENDPLHSVVVGFERFRAAQYSRELSDKIFKGCAKVSEQGFRPGGFPPYGLSRLLLDEARRPVRVLKTGEWKGIQNQRVTLAPGDSREVEVVRGIFDSFVSGRLDEEGIADSLNRDGVPSPGGVRWSAAKVRRILTNAQYVGTMVYNRTTKRLLSPVRANPRERWIFKEGAFEGILPREVFEKALEIFRERTRRCSADRLLERIGRLYERHGVVTAGMIRAAPDLPSYQCFLGRLRGIGGAFQALHPAVREDVGRIVRERLSGIARKVEACEDFLVLNDRLTVLVQPSVPVPWGYRFYWPFHPDHRPVVDITLGVPLSGTEEREILGYLAFPRLLVREQAIRLVGGRDGWVNLFGHNGLDVILDLLK